VAVSGDDSLGVDDLAYLYLPLVRRYRVLLITDEGADKYLRYALSSSKDIELRTAIPPVIPDFDYFDVVVMGELKKDFLLPGTFRDLRLYAEKGAMLYSSEAGISRISRTTKTYPSSFRWSSIPLETRPGA